MTAQEALSRNPPHLGPPAAKGVGLVVGTAKTEGQAIASCTRHHERTMSRANPGSVPTVPRSRIIVAAVADEGDTVIVWGRPATDGGDPIGFAFHTKGEHADVAIAERASRLAVGTEAVIDYTAVADGWNVARNLALR